MRNQPWGRKATNDHNLQEQVKSLQKRTILWHCALNNELFLEKPSFNTHMLITSNSKLKG